MEDSCATKFSLKPDFSYVQKFIGGRNYTKTFKNYQKIIFSNGDIDPIKANSVTKFISLDIPVYNIKGGAHSLDLRLPHVNETEDITNVNWVRKQECLIIGQWIDEYQGKDFGEMNCNFTVNPIPPTPPTPPTPDNKTKSVEV